MADSDIELDDDQTLSKTHAKLLNTVGKLDFKQRIKKAALSEPSTEVSEFHLIKSGVTDKNLVNVINLAKNLNRTAAHNEIKKQFLKSRSKAKTLPKPLEKPVADRIKRSVGFEKTKKELTKWNGIVARNRTIGQITFPLSQPCMKMDPQFEIVNRIQLKSDLEKEFEKFEAPKEEVTVDKEEEKYSLTKEELLEKHREAAKTRAQESYKAAKARRQKKIKSKKFHRVQRKQKLKAEIKEFEELQKTDPEAALEKLEILDKVRAKERMSLRHKNTGQWAKNLQVRAKYDKESRQALAQQLAISRELTAKLKNADDSDEEDERVLPAPPPCITADDENNPWMNKMKTSKEIDDFVSGYRKYWEEKNEKEQQITEEDEHRKNNKENMKDEEQNNVIQITAANNPVESVKIIKNDNITDKTKKKKSLKKSNKAKTTNIEVEKESNGLEDGKSKKLNKTTLSSDIFKSKKRINQNKVNGKETKRRKIKTCGTSQWAVESDDSCTAFQDNELDDLFQNAEQHVQKLVSSKIKEMHDKVNRNSLNVTNKQNREDNSEDDYLDKLSLKPDNLRPSLDEPMLEITNKKSASSDSTLTRTKVMSNETNTQKVKEAEINADSFIVVKPQHIKSQLPNSDINDALDDSDLEEDQNQIISEAFEDDDAVKDFTKEKEEEIKNDQPEDIDLSLPGWGSWGGKNIKMPTRKRKKFLIKMPKPDKRKDENKGNVIIIEEKDAKIRKHLVSDVPFPFKNVKDFEASLRAPIGRDFVPEKVHKKLIEPAVKTKMGKIIEPMDEDVLVKKVNKKRKLLN